MITSSTKRGCNKFGLTGRALLLTGAALAWPVLTLAQTAPAPATGTPSAAQEKPSEPQSWSSAIKLSAQVEGGIVFNPDSPKTNVGQLFTDKANQPLLNQVLLTAARTIDPKATGWDVGFKLQALYGTDARYTHFLGVFDRAIKERTQVDVVEANATLHVPLLTEGGTDIKAGLFSTPLGFEVIDPNGNPFYSHSYIFNFGIPLKHTGVLATVHATSIVDIYGGIDSGVNTTLGYGDNNSAGAVTFGFGLNLLDGNLTILALSHIGPENASRAVPNANHYQRYLNDAYATYKFNDKLSTTTELNYIRDDLARAEGWGVAQYASYTLTEQLTLNGRGELWRDNKGFFVASFPGNLDYVRSEEGRPANVIGTPRTTYGALTLGVTYKPVLPTTIVSLAVRPEIRYDRSLNGSKPFNGGRSGGALTLASDFILGF